MSTTADKLMSTTADKPTGPAFVVFGIGADKKPRAARFEDSQPKLVAKAAELMNLKLREVNSPALADVAKQLPIGRLYANGNGFVPPVRKQLYATLAARVAAANRNAATTKAADGAPFQGGSPGLPRSWDEIAPGHLVIANEGIGEGWWEAIVVEVNGDKLTLHWRDYPWQPNIVQPRSVGGQTAVAQAAIAMLGMANSLNVATAAAILFNWLSVRFEEGTRI